MKQVTTSLAVIAAALLLAACAKKEEAAAAPEAAPAEIMEPAADASMEANSEDAEQSGGDKVSVPEPEPEGG